MLLGDGIVLSFWLQGDLETEHRREYGRADDDGSHGLMLFNEKNELIEELPRSKVERWKIVGPNGKELASNRPA
jgi:hypothetical protein